MDFVQPAWQEFFRRRDDWGKIETPRQLVALLLRIATNHLRRELRRFHRKRRGYDVVPLDDAQAQSVPDLDGPPECAIAMLDRLEAVLARCPEHHRQMLGLRA